MWTTDKIKTKRRKKNTYGSPCIVKNVRFDEYVIKKYEQKIQDLKIKKELAETALAKVIQELNNLKISTSRGHIRLRMKLEKLKEKLEKDLQAILNQDELEEFKLQIKPYTDAYEREVQLTSVEKIRGTGSTLMIEKNNKGQKNISHVSIHRKDQSDVFKNFIEDIERKAPDVQIIPQETCEECDEVMVLEPRASALLCSFCGSWKPYLDATSSHMAYGEEVEFTSFAYLRLNHFNERMTYAQAKESTQIPDKVVAKVMEWLFTNRVRDVGDITLELTYKAMKVLKLRNYYKQNTQLWCKITGNPPLRMSPTHEEQLRNMFKAVNRLWPKYKPKDRKNFLSYNYCLYKFNELLGYDSFLPYFKLLKGDKKLEKQDEIFKKICQDPELQWQFIRSRS